MIVKFWGKDSVLLSIIINQHILIISLSGNNDVSHVKNLINYLKLFVLYNYGRSHL